MPLEDIYEIRVEGVSGEGERWNMVWHMQKIVEQQDELFASSQALADHAGTKFATFLLPHMHESWTFTSTRANRVHPSIGIPAVSGEGAGPGEGNFSEALPADIAAVITKRTNVPGASFRGRNYFGGLMEHNQNGGVLVSVDASNIVGGFEAVIGFTDADAEGNQWRLGVFSRKNAAIPVDLVFANVTRMMCDRNLRNMRPRSNKTQAYVSS